MTDTILATQLGTSVFFVHLLQWLKNANWFPWLTQNTDIANKIVNVIAALVLSLGVTFTMNGTFQTGGTITFTFPDVWKMLSGFAHFCAQYGAQQGYYHTTVKQ